MFINTSPPESRSHLLKSKIQLENLWKINPNSIEIFESNVMDYYVQRPDFMDNWTLADFTAKCEYTKTKRKTKKSDNDENFEIIDDDIDELDIYISIISIMMHAKKMRKDAMP